MGSKDDKRLISLAKKMGGRVHKIVEDVQLDEKKKPISTRLGDAFDSGELEDRIKSMSGPARKSLQNLANSLVDFYHTMGDIHQVDGRQLEDKIDGSESPPRVRKMFAKLLDEDDVQLDEVTGETTVMAKSDRNQYERITRALTAANRTGKIKGYEGLHFNERTGMLTLIFDSKAHKPASERRKVAKMIKDFGLEIQSKRVSQVTLNGVLLLPVVKRVVCVRQCPVQKKLPPRSKSDRKRTTLIFTKSDRRESLHCVVIHQVANLLEATA